MVRDWYWGPRTIHIINLMIGRSVGKSRAFTTQQRVQEVLLMSFRRNELVTHAQIIAGTVHPDSNHSQFR